MKSILHGVVVNKLDLHTISNEFKPCATTKQTLVSNKYLGGLNSCGRNPYCL